MGVESGWVGVGWEREIYFKRGSGLSGLGAPSPKDLNSFYKSRRGRCEVGKAEGSNER